MTTTCAAKNLLAITLLMALPIAQAQTGPFGIATIAGTPYDPSGDNGPATQAATSLSGAAFRDGNLYLTDGNRVRKIGPNGIITTIAGQLDSAVHQPIGGYSGDGGPALSAEVHGVDSLEFDPAGNLYLADNANSCVRKLTARTVGGVPQPFFGTETISTVAGSCLFIGNSGDGGPATSAKINFPRALAIDPVSGALYIADYANNNVRKVLNGIITTVAGTGAAGFSGDGGLATAATLNGAGAVAVDSASGDLYIGDLNNNRIRKVSGGIISTIAGTGASTALGNVNDNTAAITANVRPTKIRFAAGILYIADSGNDTIRTINISTGIINTIAGIETGNYAGGFPNLGDGGPAIDAQFKSMSEPALDGQGGIFILDGSGKRVRYAAGPVGVTILNQTVAAGNIMTVEGPPAAVTFSGDGGPALSALFFGPGSLAVDAAGNIFVVDGANDRIREIDASRNISTIAGTGTGGFSFGTGAALSANLQPGNLALSPGGIYFTTGGTRILKLSAGQLSYIANQSGVTSPGSPDGTSALLAKMAAGSLAFDSNGNLYIGDTSNGRLWRIDSTGTVKAVAGAAGTKVVDGVTVVSAPANSAIIAPANMAFDARGNLYIADNNQNRIYKMTAHSTGQPLDGTETLSLFAGSGALGSSPDGTPATASALDFAGGLVFDPTGNLYFNDGAFRIRRIGADGLMNTVAGTGNAGFSGDGGPALGANIRGGNLAFDTHGNLFMSDGVNNVVRVLDNVPPTITYTGNAGIYSLTQAVNITCAASDTGASIATSTCANITGTFSAGPHTFTATATDRAGNRSTASTTFTVVSGAAPLSGNTCNGFYTGTFNGNITLTSGQTCGFISGGITGNVQGVGNLVLTGGARVNGDTTLNGGNLSLSGGASVGGNLTLTGSTAFTLGPLASIGNNLTIQSVPAGLTLSSVCGTSVKGNLTVQSDGSPLELGSASAACPGNTIGGNLQAQQNTGSLAVFDNVVNGNLQCQNNSTLTGLGNTAKQKQGQCTAF